MEVGILDCVLHARNLLGEGPRWHTEESALYWTDIEAGKIHRFVPANTEYAVYEVGLPVGSFAFANNGSLLLAVQNTIAFWEREKQTLIPVASVAMASAHSRFNDGATDAAGRFWVGAMGGGRHNKLYRADHSLSFQVLETGIGVANGIGWSPDGRTMYFTDSAVRLIYAYDFDLATGALRNRRVFARVPESDGVPDGLTVDSEGFVWSAHWDGWQITRYDPTGRIERVIKVPVQRPTSCTFGGQDLSDLYITTARAGLTEQDLADQPWAGGLLRAHTSAMGMKDNRFIINRD